ncbi:MAG: hypothetical protein V4437_00755 [Patescibacteria group bacterium]
MIHHHHYYSDGFAIFFIVTLLSLITYSAFSNPYGRMSRVRNPFETKLQGREILLLRRFKLKVCTSMFWRLFAYAKCAWHIISNVHAGSKAKSTTVEGVIRDIHRVRFNPKRPYLISGDHFNVFYPRNLGVFYYAMLDPRTALGKSDWQNRQRIYLQSVAYALSAFSTNGDCTTTIVPVGTHAVACVNIYHYPSDALYGVLFGLSALLDNSFFLKRYPFESENSFRLETKDAAESLLQEYHTALRNLITKYYEKVFDKNTGLIRTDIHISSAKDITIRSSAFYDNVIFWKTFKLARSLGIEDIPHVDLNVLKSRILETYWYEEGGYFLEDQSPEGIAGKYYSADWLAAYFTGFLDVAKPEERRFLERSTVYTIEKGIDMPFPLRYQETDRASRQVPVVRLVVASYGGTAIWSFWGAEFIKLLVALSEYENNHDYLERAARHIAAYAKNMVRYHGCPEVYDTEGNMLRTPLYNSVRQTGWVVGYEQAVALFKSMSAKRTASEHISEKVNIDTVIGSYTGVAL